MKLVLRLKEIVLARPRPFNVWNTGKQTKMGGATRLCAWRRCKNHFAPSCSRISQPHFARSCSWRIPPFPGVQTRCDTDPRSIPRPDGDQTNQGRELLLDPHQEHMYRGLVVLHCSGQGALAPTRRVFWVLLFA